MKIGAHVSTSGGVLKAFERAEAIGADCFQIFSSSPRMWHVPPIDTEIAASFLHQLSTKDMMPSFVHIKYLVNLGSPDDTVYTKSVETVKQELRVCSALGLQGAMFHIGSPKGSLAAQSTEKVVSACQEILKDSPSDVLLILENSSSPNKLGSTVEEIADLLARINSSQVGICLDTAHAFASGYDMRSHEGIYTFVEMVSRYIGIDRLALIHANDSKGDFKSGRDLHENIGQGKIGETGFYHLLHHPQLSGIPFILEVPGFSGKGPDKENVGILKKLAQYTYENTTYRYE